MRFSSYFGPSPADFLSILLVLSIPTAHAVDFTPVPSPDLDLSKLNRVALAGDFDAISLYSYSGQNENAFATNGSQSLLTQSPNGAFAPVVSSDASINAMCAFVRRDGTTAGIVVGGNFTSMGGVQTQGVAMFDPNSGKIIALPGLSGQVDTLLCDQDTDTVYVGGEFTGANSTNAIAWVGMAGWSNLPFAGFNGKVAAISKASNGNVVFGGSFTGLGNTAVGAPGVKDQQIINLSSANISAVSSTSAGEFSDPQNIVCKTQGQDGPGSTWLLADGVPGSWRADMNFGYQPTKLRIWNTHQDGRGTKTFRFTAFPINGIMNLTYIDPDTGINQTCDARCPLSNNNTAKYQDFRFINVIGMNSFQIDISDWYGSGGGLGGIELFQDAIFAYAVEGLNEPVCSVTNTFGGSNSTQTGPWTVTQSGGSDSQYLSASLAGPTVNSTSASVVFLPDIKQSGNYTVMLYTPGCKQDNSCGSRGIVNVTGTFGTATSGGPPVATSTTIYQTNDFPKYDQIWSGAVEANSDAFRPNITLKPLDGWNKDIIIVAQSVRFEQNNASSGGLNGLFEFDPNQATANTDFTTSAIDVAGTNLSTDALVTTITVVNGNTYVGGNFTGPGGHNIFFIANGAVSSLPDQGLNAAVITTFALDNILYVGGNFSDTVNPSTPGLRNVGAYDTTKKVWQTLGGGVNGQVNSLVPLTLNISDGQPETCITVSGFFTDVMTPPGSNNKLAAQVKGLAIWVPSRNDWLQNLNVRSMKLNGQLNAALNVSGNSILAGTLSSQGLAANDAVAFATSGNLTLNPIGIHLQPQTQSSSNGQKASVVTPTTINGGVTGLFDTYNNRNLTVIGGSFSAIASDKSTINNLAIINNTASGDPTVTGFGSGLDPQSVIVALAAQQDTLYAGGTLSGALDGGTVNGLVLWNLAQGKFASPQPSAFVGASVAVNAISLRPSSSEIYVGGSFDTAGSLNCPAMCVLLNGQWSRPGIGMAGNISTLMWQGNNQLLVGGNLTVSKNATTLANYDANQEVWTSLPAATSIPGPVAVLAPANSGASKFWIAGKSNNGSAYLMKYDGSNFQSIGDVLGDQTTIRGLSVLTLSQNHADNNLVDANMALLVTGQLSLPNFGNASAALFNGTDFSPFILSNSGNSPGSLSQLITENQQDFGSAGSHLALGFVILIALALALACLFLIIILGFVIERRRRRKEGYRPAPQNYYEKTTNMGRIPPEHLFSPLGTRGPSAGPHL